MTDNDKAIKAGYSSHNSMMAAHHYRISRSAAQRGFAPEAERHAKIAREFDLKDLATK